MNNTYIQKKIIIGALAIILFIAFAATVFCTSNNVALAADDGVIYYGDFAYGDTIGSATSEVEEFEYATKQVTSAYVNPSYPYYYNTNNDLKNGCANVAGASIIGFYDRFYENLIPDSTPGFIRRDIYTYYPIGIDMGKKQAVIDALYVSMKTNNPHAGTSQANYKSGLEEFVESKDMNITFTSVMTNGNFDSSKAMAQLNAGRPITLYLQGYNISNVEDTGSNARIMKVIYLTNHVMIAYAYQKIDYYNVNGTLINSKIYLNISSGEMGVTGVYIVNNNGILNDAESVNIF